MTPALLTSDRYPRTAPNCRINEPAQLRLRVLRDLQSIAASRAAWNQLAGDHPFMCWEWIFSWWQSFGHSREAVVLVVEDQSGRWVGLFPLCIEPQRWWGRVLVNMANGRACSDHVRPMIEVGYHSQVIKLMGDWIEQQSTRGAFDLIDWDGLDAGDPVVEQLIGCLSKAGLSRCDMPIEASWVIDLPSDWAPFEKSIKKCFRRKIQKARRNEQLPGVEILALDKGDDLREVWPTIVRLHEARRDALAQIGCFHESGFEQFLLNAVSRLAERGAAKVLLAKHDGEPFGMVVLLLGKQRAHMFQSGFDPLWRRLEPGHLMATQAVQFAMKNGHNQFDFLRGDEPYKARWNAVATPMVRVRLAPRRWMPILRLRLWTAIRALKKRLHSSTRPPAPEALAGESEG